MGYSALDTAPGDYEWEGHHAEALEILRTPAFLKTPYGSPLLRADFGEGETLEISFGIHLGDGTLLSDTRNFSLLSEIYDFILLSGAQQRGRRNAGPEALRQNVLGSLPILDYFLLNHKEKLTKHGFSSITSADLIQLLRTAAGSSRISDSLYGWSQRLTDFLVTGIHSLTAATYRSALRQCPAILDSVFLDSESELGLTPKDMRRAKAFLHLNGYYNQLRREGLVTVNTRKLVKEIFKNCLCVSVGDQVKPTLMELALGERVDTLRELPRVPVRTGLEDDKCSVRNFAKLKSALLVWKKLVPFKIGITPIALSAAESYDVNRTIELKADGHTKPVPTPHILYAMRRAMPFFYDHAEHLLESYGNVLVAANELAISPAWLSSKTDFEALLTEKTKALGIHKWSIIERGAGYSQPTRPFDYYDIFRLRAVGLCEYVKALYGASGFIAGFMCAGRIGEVRDFAGNSLDVNGEWVSLSTRKSGFGRHRRSHWRPVPNVVYDVFGSINHFQGRLRAKGIKVPEQIFAAPTYHGSLSTGANALDVCADHFFDLIEMPTDSEGRRYYVRQHQLRQFFILAFFYAAGVGGLDTLRWFVRHFDAEHLWAYLRSSVPGAAMMRYKAVAVKGLLRNNAPEVTELVRFLRVRLGVARFNVMTDGELVNYLGDLQSLGQVTIEPLFFKENASTYWRMGVSVFGEE